MEAFLTTSSAKIREFFGRISGQALLFIVLGFLEFISIELFLDHNPLTLEIDLIIKNVILYLLSNLILLSLFHRMRPAMLFSSFCVICLGTINYLLQLFRGYGLVFMDLYAIHTAVAVAGCYSFEWKPCFLAGMAVGILSVFLCLLFPAKRNKYFQKRMCLLSLAGFVSSAVFFFWIFSSGTFFRDVNDLTWDHRIGIHDYGYFLYFAANAEIPHVSEPDGYSPQQAEEILSRYMDNEGENSLSDSQEPREISALSAGKNPNLILIMNEAYSDLRVLGEDFYTNQPVMPFYDSLQENTIKAYAESSVYAGYTSNSEFEFLTGCSKAFLPGNPYLQYITEPLPSLITTIKEQKGYETATALHPYIPSGYSRNRVYPLLGFDTFFSLEDFSEQEYIREYVSDSWDYRQICELYERKDADTSLCLFNVTMQNHNPYTADWISDDPVKAAGWLGDQKVNQYLSLIKKSDDALQELVSYFDRQSEPTLILLFGDHQPRLPDQFYKQLMGKFPTQFGDEDVMKKHLVPYLLWANYDIPKQSTETTSLNYLSGLLLETAGLQTTAFQRFLLDMEKHLPSISANGYYDAEGKLGRIEQPEGEAEKWLWEYEILQYYYLFDTKHREDKYFTIS